MSLPPGIPHVPDAIDNSAPDLRDATTDRVPCWSLFGLGARLDELVVKSLVGLVHVLLSLTGIIRQLGLCTLPLLRRDQRAKRWTKIKRRNLVIGYTVRGRTWLHVRLGESHGTGGVDNSECTTSCGVRSSGATRSMGRIASLEVCVRDADSHYFPHLYLYLVQKGILCSLWGRVWLWGLVLRLPDETHGGDRRADSWGLIKVLDEPGVLRR